MSMNSTTPFENGINAESLVRRLKNVERKLEKIGKRKAKTQPENNKLPATDSSEPRIRSTSQSPIDEGSFKKLQEPTDLRYHSQHQDLEQSDDNIFSLRQYDVEQKRKDEQNGDTVTTGLLKDYPNSSIERDPEGEFGAFEAPSSPSSSHDAKIIALLKDPNVEWRPIDPNDPRIRSYTSLLREEEEEMRREGKWPPPHSPTHSSVVSSGYIGPPEKRSPSGRRIWTYRDFQAGRLPRRPRADGKDSFGQRWNNVAGQSNEEKENNLAQEEGIDASEYHKAFKFKQWKYDSKQDTWRTKTESEDLTCDDKLLSRRDENDVNIGINIRLNVDSLLPQAALEGSGKSRSRSWQFPKRRRRRRVGSAIQKKEQTSLAKRVLNQNSLGLDSLVILLMFISLLIGFIAGGIIFQG